MLIYHLILSPYVISTLMGQLLQRNLQLSLSVHSFSQDHPLLFMSILTCFSCHVCGLPLVCFSTQLHVQYSFMYSVLICADADLSVLLYLWWISFVSRRILSDTCHRFCCIHNTHICHPRRRIVFCIFYSENHEHQSCIYMSESVVLPCPLPVHHHRVPTVCPD
jgi:hypothetical protein